MELLNPTPLPGVAFRQYDQDGDLDCVVALRGTFRHRQGHPAEWCDRQEKLQWQDAYEGDPQETPLLRQTDLTPGKTGTDVTYLGASFAPGGPAREWDCSLHIGPIDKRLSVTGPREWQPDVRPARWPLRREAKITGWSLSPPEPAAQVDMDWRHSFGGSPEFDPDAEPDDRNPIGRGRLGSPETWRDTPLPAPQIHGGDLTPDDDATPAGLGPIPPFWAQRSRHAGTYDEDWQANRHPLLPRDFDPRFWQSAPEDQIARPYLRGDEAYRLTNLHPEHPLAEGRLPGLGLALRLNDGPPLALNLDGVQFDWREAALILLTWRIRFPLPDAQGAKLHLDWHWLAREVAA